MLHAFFLGIIEGLTEFLPISSTAHLILFNYFMGIDLENSASKVLIISIQLGAILSVVFYYFKEFFKKETIYLLISGTLPTIILALLLQNLSEKAFTLPFLICFNLIFGGIIILFVEKKYQKDLIFKKDFKKEISNKDSFVFGIVQALAIFPGVSRSGAVIMYGLYKNFEREIIAKYTFLLAVPTMFAATFYSILKSILIGFIISFLTALLIVKFALPFIKKYSFTPFAWYRILLGTILFLVIFYKG
jgi:undecaprenyl-diphosphatase